MTRHWNCIKKGYVRALCALGLIVGNYTVNGLGLPANATEMTTGRSFDKMETVYEPVSTDASKPTEVKDTTYYRVQDGGNYLLFSKYSLPATIAYIPDSAFGPIPKAYRGVDEELTCIAGLLECRQGWMWQLEASDQDWMITVEAHEDATIWVMPSKSEIVDPCEGEPFQKTIEETANCMYNFGGKVLRESGTYIDTLKTEEGCDSIVTLILTIVKEGCEQDPCEGKEIIETVEKTANCMYEFGGEWITESGTYKHAFTTVEGCDSVVTLILTIDKEGCEQDPCEGKTIKKTIEAEVCDKYTFGGKVLRKSGTYVDTLKTVEGCDSIVTLNLKVGVGCGDLETIYFCKGMNTEHIEGNRSYKEYEYGPPEEWFNVSDYMVEGSSDSTLMDLHRANESLYNHYVDSLMPVTQIIWSHRNVEKTIYSTVAVADGPQWIPAGVLVVRVSFLCGESYNSSDFETDIVNVNAAQKPVKVIENGQVVIIRGGEKYNILGTRLR